MPNRPQKNRELGFALNDVARLLRTYADQKAAQFGMTRAKWAVLARLDRAEGLKQSELADVLDLHPISLTRLLDGLCESGLIERRADPDDRRAKRLYLMPTARPLLERLTKLGEALMEEVLDGLDETRLSALHADLDRLKTNLRRAIQHKPSDLEKHYG
ncbi:MAG TPA: MarR family transcriptional regulator [Methylocella sp.]|nr:MarR family transcriptional regulator [Methylocella sp.]